MKNARPYRILIADDEENTRQAIDRALQLLGYEVSTACDGKEAIQLLTKKTFDLLLLDLRMPQVDGVEVMNFIQSHSIQISVIVLTAHASLESAISAIRSGAVDYLLKPKSILEIQDAIQRTLKRRAPEIQRRHLIDLLEDNLDVLRTEENSDKEILTRAASSVSPGKILLLPDEHRMVLPAGIREQELIVDLTRDQTSIVVYMEKHAGHVVNSLQIIEHALGYSGLSQREADRIIRLHILRLREKIESNPRQPQIIRTVRGAGYSYHPEI